MPENNERQNQEESYTMKYQRHIAWRYGYKSVCVSNKVSKHFKSYLDENVIWSKKVNTVLI